MMKNLLKSSKLRQLTNTVYFCVGSSTCNIRHCDLWHIVVPFFWLRFDRLGHRYTQRQILPLQNLWLSRYHDLFEESIESEKKQKLASE